MYGQEKIKPYSVKGEKKEQVEEMFDGIAPTYDLLNHRMSFSIDKYWRRQAINRLKPYSPERILDVATGTGDLAILAARELKASRIDGIDLSEKMMKVAEAKVKRESQSSSTFIFNKMDATQMTFDDNSFDAVISAFGIRNFQELDKGLAEMCRVLKPGGHLSIVELTTPARFPMKQLFKTYSHIILPLWGRVVAKDTKAYEYLTRTIEAFPQGEQMKTILTNAGFAETGFRRLTFGICTLYFATKK